SAPETGDGDRHVTFADNYFGATKSLGAYLNGTSAAGSDFHFTGNFFGALDFTYDKLDPAATDPGVVFGVNTDFDAPVFFDQDTWEGSKKLVAGLAGPNGTTGAITATGNVNAAVAPVAFVASGYPDG